MSRIWCLRAIALCIVITPTFTHADDSDLITDRPDFTESGVVVPLRSVQVESGASFTVWNDDVTVVSGPELLVRWSPFERFEVRLGAPDLIDAEDNPTGAGWGDSSLGAKVQLGPAGAWDVAAIATFSLPTGDDQHTSDEVDPVFILATGRDLGNGWSLGGQFIAAWPSAGDDRELVWGERRSWGPPSASNGVCSWRWRWRCRKRETRRW